MKKNLRILSLLVVGNMTLVAVCGAQAEQKPSPAGLVAQQGFPAGLEVEPEALKDQMRTFEGVLNRSVREAFQQPFTILQDAKGVYLPRFGVAFHMEVNLHPLRFLTPFDPGPYSSEELQAARESRLTRITQLKERLQELLVEHGGELDVVPPDQNVAVAVHLFNLPSERSDGLPTQVVIGASRRTLLEYQAQKLTAEDLRKRKFSVEF